MFFNKLKKIYNKVKNINKRKIKNNDNLNDIQYFNFILISYSVGIKFITIYYI
jgi:hypothetical protein